MSWLSRLQGALDLRLFSIGDQAITPAQLIILVAAIIATAVIAHALRLTLERRLLKIDAAQRHVIARLSHHLVWLMGIVIGLRLVNIDLTALTIVIGALGLGTSTSPSRSGTCT